MLKFILFIILAIIYLLLPKNSANIKFINLKKYIIMIIVVTIMISIIIFSDSSYLAAKNGFMLWVNNIIPSLLPFFICIDLLKHTEFVNIIGKLLNPLMRPIFNVPGAGAFAITMGITSGYPVGAKIASELYLENKCTKTEAERLLSFTNTSGPLFIISAVGISMFASPQIGLLLLITHFLSSLTVGFIFRNYKNNIKSRFKDNSEGIITQKHEKINKNDTLTLNNLGLHIGNAIQNSISTLLLICGYIVFFAVLGNILEKYRIIEFIANIIAPVLWLLHIPTEFGAVIIKGLLEVTNGLEALSNLMNLSDISRIIMSAFLLGFGGLSVLMQTASIVSKANLSLKPYIIGKFLHGLIAALYTFLVLEYTNFFSIEAVTAFSYNISSPAIVNETSNMISMLCTLVLVGIGVKVLKKVKI